MSFFVWPVSYKILVSHNWKGQLPNSCFFVLIIKISQTKMRGKIIKVISSTKIVTFVIEIEGGGTAKTNIVRTFRNAGNWVDLEPGDRIRNLFWKNESEGIIDGDSPIERE
jgi:hypothetical protein